MRAVLSASITVECFAAFAEMAWLERRPELGLLCRTAMEHDDRLSEAVVQSALPGLPDAGARNVISWCRTLGLCDDHNGLTELGKDVAESDEAPVPEQGVYGFWFAQHPLFGRRILAVERVSPNRDYRLEDIEPLNTKPDRGVVFRSVVNTEERFVLRDLPANHGKPGCLRRPTKATCRVQWTLDFDGERDQWQLDGDVDPKSGRMPLKHEPEVAGIDLWRLASTWRGSVPAFSGWSAKEHRLAVAYGRLSPAELDTFLKTVELGEVSVPGKGEYQDVTLCDVPIGPASARDAQEWAMSRLLRHLVDQPGYRSRSELRHVFAELTEDTPLEHFEPTLPSHDSLIADDRHAKQPDVFWGLAAPVDLALHAVPSNELGELTIGEPAVEIAPAAAGGVRIPYRGGWTMRKFVDRLLGGCVPLRLLLCDRYVRGVGNLATLKLFVDAVRDVNADVAFDVWTDEQEADFPQIKSITGTEPRAYAQAFGRNQPHDRYVLILPKAGERFAWHLSNSPLHARADVAGASPATALRWKDLAGTKACADELEPVFREWFAGAGR